MDAASRQGLLRETSHITFIALIALFALGMRAWVISHTEVAARDSIGFIRFAAHLDSPPLDDTHPGEALSRLEVIRRSEHPPGYPVAIWLISHPIREITGKPITDPDTMVLTCQIVSATAGLLLIVPMYFLGCMILRDRDLAFIATLLFQSLPVFIEITSDGLSDGMYLLSITTTLWIGAIAFRSPGWWKFTLAGVGAGLTYLVRPEGLMVAVAIGGLIALLKMRSLWTWRMSFARASALALGVFLVCGPYVGVIGKLTNKPTGGHLINRLLGRETPPAWKGESSLPRTTLFAAWYQGEQPKSLWAGQAVAKEMLKTGNYIVPLFGLVGFGLLARRLWNDPAFLLVGVLGLTNSMILFAVAMGIGYVSERHTLLVVMLSCYFAASVIPIIGRWISGFALIRRDDDVLWTRVAVLVIVLGGLPVALHPLHANRAPHHAAGLWLKDHAESNALILDPFCWSEFYAGHAWGYGPPRPPHHVGPIYVVVEPSNGNPHSRLPLIEMTRTMMQAGKPVWHYPSEGSVETAKVVVYRVIPE